MASVTIAQMAPRELLHQRVCDLTIRDVAGVRSQQTSHRSSVIESRECTISVSELFLPVRHLRLAQLPVHTISLAPPHKLCLLLLRKKRSAYGRA